MPEKKGQLAAGFRCAVSPTAALLLPVFLFLAACGGGSGAGGGGTPPPSIASVVISPSGANIAVGQTTQFNATAKDPSGNVISGVSFSWNSDNSLVATVRNDGTVNGTGAGTAHISASAGGVSGSSTLNVSGASSAIGTSFFGMTSLTPDDYPAVTVGALGHPPTFAWGWIEQSRGVYTWTGFDTYVEQAEAHGLMDANHTVNMVVTFGSTPGWAAADPSTCRVVSGVTLCASPPANIQDWTNFVAAVINHYNGVIEPHIKYYELWNEANRSNFWSGSPADMVTLAQAAYPIIHSDSNSLLLTPSVTGPIATGFSTTASVFMSRYLDAGGSKYADAGTFHGYVAETGVAPYPMPEQDSTSGCTAFSNCYGSVVSRTNAMRSLLDAHGLAGKPMYDTEGSWGDGNVTDPDTQTAWLARWYLLQASLASADDLRSVHWYSWGNGTWGNIETTSRQPTAAGVAYNQVFQWLVGATFSTICSSDSNSTWTCGLTRSGGYQAQAAWNTNGTATYNPPSQFTQYRDLQGNVSHISGPVTIGIKPILLETGNIP